MTKTIGTTGLTRQELNVLVAEKEELSVRTYKHVNMGQGDSGVVSGFGGCTKVINYCQNASDASPIIEKIWDALMCQLTDKVIRWEVVIKKHNCTKLEAAMLVYVGRT